MFLCHALHRKTVILHILGDVPLDLRLDFLGSAVCDQRRVFA
ncbi:hypothetical protein SDC9_207766 [bioreactor metagenome]|uniref:Uncharacterized protein n=1 Tax=bioreactor metagenome TaxID=1076179 RepID=A0A645JK85_9ZZZZ